VPKSLDKNYVLRRNITVQDDIAGIPESDEEFT
jgi:hypothetical protein